MLKTYATLVPGELYKNTMYVTSDPHYSIPYRCVCSTRSLVCCHKPTIPFTLTPHAHTRQKPVQPPSLWPPCAWQSPPVAAAARPVHHRPTTGRPKCAPSNTARRRPCTISPCAHWPRTIVASPRIAGRRCWAPRVRRHSSRCRAQRPCACGSMRRCAAKRCGRSSAGCLAASAKCSATTAGIGAIVGVVGMSDELNVFNCSCFWFRRAAYVNVGWERCDEPDYR